VDCDVTISLLLLFVVYQHHLSLGYEHTDTDALHMNFCQQPDSATWGW